MSDNQEQMVLVAKLVDQVSDKLKEINKAMLATEAASRKAHQGGAEHAEKHRRSIELLARSFEQIKEASVELVKPSFAAIGIASFSLAGAIGAVVEAVKSLGEQGIAIEKTSRRSGLLADKIRELQGIGMAWGTTLEETNAGLANFGDFMDRTARRAPDAIRAWMQMPGLWQALGRSLDGLGRKEQIDKVLDFLPNVRHIDQRRRILQLLGLPENYAYMTREELQKLRREEQEWTHNHPFAKDNALKADENFTKIRRSLMGIRDDLGAAFGGPVLEALEGINHFLEKKENIEGIKDAFKALGREVHETFDFVKDLIGKLKEFDEWRQHGSERPGGAFGQGKAPVPGKSDWTPYGLFSGPKGAGPGKTGKPYDDEAARLSNGMRPISFTEGFSQSETTRHIEDPIYRAMLRALSEWWQSVTIGNATKGGGGFQNANFGGSGGAAAGGGFGSREYPNLGNGDVPAGSGPAPKGAMMRGNKREVAKIAADEFSRAGLPKEGIAGIFQNVMDESGFNPNSRHADQPRYSGEAHYAHGLYQEGGAEWNRYAGWLQKNYPGSDWRDPRLQTRFLAENLKKNYPRTWGKLMKSDRFHAGAAFVDEYLKPAAQHRRGRMNKYLRGGVAPMEHYTGPMEKPGEVARTTDGQLLKDGASFKDRFDAMKGSADISVDFKNMPHWARTAVDVDGNLFKQMKVNRGFQMPRADEGQ